jgi:hypothetical protein
MQKTSNFNLKVARQCGSVEQFEVLEPSTTLYTTNGRARYFKKQTNIPKSSKTSSYTREKENKVKANVLQQKIVFAKKQNLLLYYVSLFLKTTILS